ncbi:MAG: MBOAT family O-acyltransferase [Patescibacteria group bacterium]
MLFNSFVFIFAFLPITFLVFWLLKGKNQRYIWLTVTSYIFYGYWNWKFVFLMLASSLIDYFAGLYIHKTENSKRRKLALIISMSANLGLLGFFKYFNFGLDTIRYIGDLFNLSPNLPMLNIILPVGISFYTFQTMSYTIDVYRKKLAPTKNFFEFACYVSLFPQLVAGPIVRFSDIVDDLNNINNFSKAANFHRGLSMFVIGLGKKIIIADTIASIINPMFQDVANLNTLLSWVAILGYTYQLYFDFSGYSDMAVGLGYFFGFRFPQNFNSPYKALNISDFWRRWHISLSSWLRDYLYISLGGSRVGVIHTYFNLIITMLLGGLWHGASWTFVFWGLYHGVLLALYKMTQKFQDSLPRAVQKITTFLLVVIGWVFFRNSSFGSSWTMLKKMFGFENFGGFNLSQGLMIEAAILLIISAFITSFLPNTFQINYPTRARYAIALAAIFITCLILMNYQQAVFLYYQF